MPFYFVNSNLTIFILLGIYGATMGIFAGGLQILYSAIKVRCFLWSPFLNIAIFALAGFFAFTYFIKGASVKQGLQD